METLNFLYAFSMNSDVIRDRYIFFHGVLLDMNLTSLG